MQRCVWVAGLDCDHGLVRGVRGVILRLLLVDVEDQQVRMWEGRRVNTSRGTSAINRPSQCVAYVGGWRELYDGALFGGGTQTERRAGTMQTDSEREELESSRDRARV